MALGDSTKQAARGQGSIGPSPYVVQTTVDIAKALDDKGSALAAADAIPALAIAKNTLVLGAGAEIVTQPAGGATALTFDLGTSGGRGDAFVDGANGLQAAGTVLASESDFSPQLAAGAESVDLKVATLTGVLSSGKVRVWAIMVDCSDLGQDFTAASAARDNA